MFLLSPEADMDPGDLRYWFLKGIAVGSVDRDKQGSLKTKSRFWPRLRHPTRTQIRRELVEE